MHVHVLHIKPIWLLVVALKSVNNQQEKLTVQNLTIPSSQTYASIRSTPLITTYSRKSNFLLLIRSGFSM